MAELILEDMEEMEGSNKVVQEDTMVEVEVVEDLIILLAVIYLAEEDLQIL